MFAFYCVYWHDFNSVFKHEEWSNYMLSSPFFYSSNKGSFRRLYWQLGSLAGQFFKGTFRKRTLPGLQSPGDSEPGFSLHECWVWLCRETGLLRGESMVAAAKIKLIHRWSCTLSPSLLWDKDMPVRAFMHHTPYTQSCRIPAWMPAPFCRANGKFWEAEDRLLPQIKVWDWWGLWGPQKSWWGPI